MILELTLALLLALLLQYLFSRAGLPGLLGMITAGILLGPSLLNFISPELTELLSEFKTVALIVILIRAGLGINKKTLKKVGAPAIRMSFIPGILEGTTILFVAHFLFGFSYIEAGMLGFIIAAVSPAVVVPTMLELKDKGYGQKKEVPTLVLAGASLDDVFAITIFGVFVSLAGGESVHYGRLLLQVPGGILAGALLGLAIGFGLIWFFKKFHIRDTKKVIILMIVAILFNEIVELPSLKAILPIAGLLGIMAIGYIMLEKYGKLANRLSAKFNKVWVLAEVLLFVYIGSQVQLHQINGAIIGKGLLLLFVGLVLRSAGVLLSLIKSPLSLKEKIFSVIAYWPKATVQAAIGAVPLSLVLSGKAGSMTAETGQSILALAVLSIVVTAPIGAIGIKVFGPKLLTKDVV